MYDLVSVTSRDFAFARLVEENFLWCRSNTTKERPGCWLRPLLDLRYNWAGGTYKLVRRFPILSVKVEQVEKNVICLEVEVDSDKVNAAIVAAVRSLAHRVKVPGFRRGRVPKNILELTVGKEAILDEALELLVPKAYSQAVEEQGVEPIDRPQVEVVTIEEGAPLVFKATVEVKPEVTLGEYKGLAINKEKVVVTKEEVEDVLQNLRERQATMEASEDEPADTGDLIMVDFSGTVDGQPFEGSQAENMPLIIGTPGFYPGLGEQLVGAKKGDSLEVKIALPDDFRVAEVAGQEAVFSVVVNDVHKKRLANLDDEFAKDVSEFDTLEELKANLEKRLQEVKEQRVREKMETQAIEQVMERTEVEVPAVMATRRARTMLRNFAHELEHRGVTLEKYCEFKETTAENIEEEFLPAARESVKQELILDAIAKKENLTVTPEKLAQALDSLAAGVKDPEQAKERWSEDGTQEAMAVSLLRQEAVDLLLREAAVTEVDPEEDTSTAVDEGETAAESEPVEAKE